MPFRPLSVLFALVICASSCDRSDEPPNLTGDQEQANVELWLDRMEVGSRELFAARLDVVDAVDVKPGDRIADIGAGTGLYTLMFADRVGTDGSVFAVDIETRFLRLINQRAADMGLTNVTSVLSRPYSITLPPASIDKAFISDTYSYFEEPRRIMRTVFTALAPEGKLYVLDFEIDANTPRTDNNRHVRTNSRGVIREVSSVGFVLEREMKVEGLSETYMLEFSKPYE